MSKSHEDWRPEPSFDPRPVVKTDFRRGIYSPEVQVLGVHYIAGPDQKSHEEALAKATEVVEALRAQLLLVVLVFASNHRIAKP
jgi:hypothetical protein